MPLTRRDVLLIGSGAASVIAGGRELSLFAAANPASVPWTLPAKRPVKIIENQWIPMKDGVRLAARFWLPEGAEQAPVPVVFE
jgi:predicted acyl esterase